MKVHELAIFWRSTTTRCFTSWHFIPAAQERAATRARQMLALFAQLSRLQIYGAALDGEPLLPTAVRPAPAGTIDARLQVDLYPDKPINPKAGSTYIKFSLPLPRPALIDLVESQRFTHRDWLALKTEVFPYLCLPDGTPQQQSGPALYRAEIAYLDLKHQPQPDFPPLTAAIARTQEDLDIARASFIKLKTEKEKLRVEKYQKRLDILYTWQYLEKDLFEQRDNLPILELTKTTSPAEADSQTDGSLPAIRKAVNAALFAPPPSDLHSPMESLSDTPAQPQTASIIRFNDLANHIEEPTAMSNTNTDTDTKTPIATPIETYLPLPPAPDAAHAWQDIAPALFLDASMWWDRNLIKQHYQLSERSFFRWIDTLRHYGLTRWLPAQGKPLLRLYYRFDLEAAVQNYQTATTKTPLHGRPRKLSQSASQPPADRPALPAPNIASIPPSAPAPASTTSAHPAEMLRPATPAIAPLPALPNIATPPDLAAQREISHLTAALIEVQAKCNGLEQAVKQLQQRCDSMAEQLHHQALSHQQAGKDDILAAIDKLARKLMRKATAPSPTAPALPSRKAKARPVRARTSARAIKKSKPPHSRPQQKSKAAQLKAKAKSAPQRRPAKKTR
jgi:hypothetical protein